MKYLPYRLKETETIDTKGKSKAFFIYLRPDAPQGTLQHEEMHVLFWYVVSLLSLPLAIYFAPWATPFCFVVDTALSQFVRPYRRFKESVAYAYQAVHSKNTAQFLVNMDSSKWHTDRFGEDFPRLVRKRLGWFK